ncbi:MAG: cupin domain-containing protein, partial [Pseudomonadota bacterium]
DDFSQRASVHAGAVDWIASPMAGVDRKPLDRIGGEVARATSIVRYAPESRFSPHVHTGGEEFLVLEGVFQDEHGDFPAGTYVRNPPTTRHEPASAPGCVILVKLWQFDLADRNQFRVDEGEMVFSAHRDGVEAALLHRDAQEEVRMERWASGATVSLPAQDGMEVFVVEGGFEDAGETFERWSWLRLPKGAGHSAVAGPAGATVWVKTGHLSQTPTGPQV